MPTTARAGLAARQLAFVTTHWSVVLSARGDSTRARPALEKLCAAYWYPLYAFVRRCGHSPHDAEDLVQSFFTRCLEGGFLAEADQAKGRFRSFLLVLLKRHLAHERDKTRARKRGGDREFIALDALDAEQRYAIEPAEHLTADRLYDRRWALTLLDVVLQRLEAEQAAAGKDGVFSRLKEFLLSARRGTPYSEVAMQLGWTETAVKVAVHRLRRRYRELLEEEIAHTVSSPEQVAEERRHLLAAVSG
jgi:RNA polymerase sigma factor (sigma-70 family)